MPSPRRMRLLVVTAMGVCVFFLMYTSRLESGSSPNSRPLQGFYHKTEHAMQEKAAVQPGGSTGSSSLPPADRDGDGDIDVDDEIAGNDLQERLKAAADRAKELANEKAKFRPDPPAQVVGVGSSQDGQDGSSDGSNSKVAEEERDTLSELNSILKKSPTIIFSKSYCPYSKRAKRILLDKYLITPEPYVVELDEHELGSNLQDALKEKTGRRTVPNILINGVSLGGADEITDLDEHGTLVDKIIELGSKRIEMVKRPASRGGGRS